jgi:ubiquinone/menaquinone biosynthesis C-methylase UbiE
MISSPSARDGQVTERLVAVPYHRLAHRRRVTQLADRLADVINGELGGSDLACIDVGCGDMSLAEQLAARLTGSSWSCVDVQPAPAALAGDERWFRYQQFDGRHLPFPEIVLDVALFCDVFHHVPEVARPELFAEGLRVARRVVVKDHLEYGRLSRFTLHLMDLFGNWGYGVPVTARYFSEASFEALLQKVGCVETTRVHPLQLYRHLPLGTVLLPGRWHFISVLATPSSA